MIGGPRQQPTRLLIAALGGEGGGVLAGWITEAAAASGLIVSRTSIPGVAQRTGATTYYIEMVAAEPGQPRPVLALNPAPGQVDVLLASELLEATRLAGAGMITADRTTLIANTQRVYTMDEKMAMADGRVDSARLERVLRGAAKRAIITDLGAVATTSKAPLSSVLCGALAAARCLPLSDDALRDAIRGEGKSVEINLAGFAAGQAAIQLPPAPAATSSGDTSTWDQSPGSDAKTPIASPSPVSEFPSRAAAIVAEGVARLTDYQGNDYAAIYRAHVRRFASVTGVDDALLAEFARHLAVRMSFEDVIRVAQLKLREARVARVTAEARARPGDIVDITEFMKPGVEEMVGLLTPKLGLSVLALADKAGWSKAAIPMTVKTTRLSGFLRLKFLASLKGWRRHTLRFQQEQAWVARWLTLVEATAKRDLTAAHEVIISAKLVRGYGDTYKRGLANWDKIATALIEPMLQAQIVPADWADRLLQARLAAEKDPEGMTLAATLSAIQRLPRSETLQAAQ